jgi:hypothetical protein
MSLQRLEDAEQKLNEQIGSLRFAVNELLEVLQVTLPEDKVSGPMSGLEYRTSIIDQHARVIREMHVQVRELDRDVGFILSALTGNEGAEVRHSAVPEERISAYDMATDMVRYTHHTRKSEPADGW